MHMGDDTATERHRVVPYAEVLCHVGICTHATNRQIGIWRKFFVTVNSRQYGSLVDWGLYPMVCISSFVKKRAVLPHGKKQPFRIPVFMIVEQVCRNALSTVSYLQS